VSRGVARGGACLIRDGRDKGRPLNYGEQEGSGLNRLTENLKI